MLARELERELSEAWSLVSAQLDSTPVVEAPCYLGVGAGDSHAAVVAAQMASGSKLVAMDPLDACSSHSLGRFADEGCLMVALSVGGRTRSVVEAVERYRSLGGSAVAVTAAPDSPLALAAGRIVRLVYGGLAAGVGAARHLVALAALAKMLGAEPRRWEPSSKPVNLSEYSVLAGVAEGVAAAELAQLKLAESLARLPVALSLEELVHAPIYAVAGGILVFESSGGGAAERTSVLRSAGYDVKLVEAASDAWTTVLGQAVWVLRSLLVAVGEAGVVEPAYRRHPRLAELTRLIYYT